MGKYIPWTPQEWAAIEQANQDGLTTTTIFTQKLLPGRTVLDIQNALGRFRANLRGQCPKCREVFPKDEIQSGHSACNKCREKDRVRQQELVQNGLCATCGKDRTGGSVRLCPTCLKTVRIRNKATVNRHRLPTSNGDPLYLFPWPGAISRKSIAAPLVGREVIDLFGGASKITMMVAEAGGKVVAWNDIHPLLFRFTQELITEPIPLLADIRALRGQMCGRWLRGELLGRYQKAMENPVRAPLGSALFYWTTRMFPSGSASRGCSPVEGPPGAPSEPPGHAVRTVSSALCGAHLTCLDFSEALGDGIDKEGRVIIADPPWPGYSNFEYNMDGRHPELLKRLLKARADFILLLSSTDATIQILRAGLPRRGGRKVFCYYRQGVLGKEIIVTTISMGDGNSIRLMPPFR